MTPVARPKLLTIQEQLEAVEVAFKTFEDELVRLCPCNNARERAIKALVPVQDAARAAFTMRSTISLDVIADLFAAVEEQSRLVAQVWVAPTTFVDLRKVARDEMELHTDPAILATGAIALLWGAQIFVTRKIAPEHVVMVADNADTAEPLPNFKTDAIPSNYLISWEEVAYVRRSKEAIPFIVRGTASKPVN